MDAQLTLVLGAAAGGLAALTVREAVWATPALARWIAGALEPLRRAGVEGYVPDALERRRLAVLGTVSLLGGGVVIAGPGFAPILALAGPALATAALRARRRRYRRAIEHGVPEVCRAIADALSAGRSVRAAVAAAAASLEGPPAAEMARVRAELELGRPTRDALAGLRARSRSARIDSLCAALVSQQLAGGDLVRLLRRLADAAADRDRAAADARSATAQARFTGMLVAAMPAGAALFAELLEPGFVAGLIAEPASAILLVAAAALQVGGFVAIGRLSRVEVAA